MKFLFKIFLVLCVSGFILSDEVAAQNRQLSQSARAILKQKCSDCHMPNAPMPFYAKLPLVKDLIQKDMEDGLVAFDIDKDVDSLTDQELVEGTLLKLETTVMDNTMPPMQYAAIHWDKVLSKQEKALLIKWLEEIGPH